MEVAIMADLVFHDLESGLHDLFTYAYTTNCQLENETLTEEEKQTLVELDPLEVLENFKDLIVDLLNFKKDFSGTEKLELAQRNEQFEAMLQKLESEVRGHIRVEQQLKLHLEVAQARVEDIEKQLDGDSVLKLRELLASKDKEIQDLRLKVTSKESDPKNKSTEDRFFAEETKGKKSHFHERTYSLEREDQKHGKKQPPRGQKFADLRDKTVSKLETHCDQLQVLLKDKCAEMESVRQDYQLLAQEFLTYKERTKAKSVLGTVQSRKSDEKHDSIHDPDPRKVSSDAESLFSKRSDASPYKNREEPIYIRSVYQTYVSHEPGKQGKKHMRTISDRAWRPSSSTKKTRPTSSMKV